MKGKTGPVAGYLGPILDTYMNSAVALVGCNSRGIERYSCELDVLVVTGDRHPPTTLKLGDAYADVVFAPESEILKPNNPEKAMSLALAKPVRDASLLLSTGSAAAAATFSDSAKVAGRTRLTSALKTVARAELAVKSSPVEADFWLLAASYEYAYAFLFSRETVPSPSHLLSQLRGASKGAAKSFEGVSIGAGLDSATRAACGTRLDALAVLHDLLREGSESATAESEWSEARTDVLDAKARELITRVELAECYSYLGQELVDDVLSVQRRHPKRSVGSLIGGGNKLLGERLVRQLGLSRDEKSVKSGLEVLKRQVVQLTKRI
ncbi:MAG: hypothetical protein JRM73_04350 [Nitrososphaerota archaeon]|nr:hypothetical protein [Nitrososphaerota archaeon]